MDQVWKAKWVDALRSGKYTQGQKSLRADETYCCLGVLCDIYRGTKWVRWPEDTTGVTKYDAHYGNEIEASTLPNVMMFELNISSEIQAELIDCNDNLRYSLDEIADWIDEHL